MKVIHFAGGGDVGGAKTHILSLINTLRRDTEVKLISFRHGPFADEARTMGIDVEVIRTGNFFKDLKRVLKAVREGQYRIVHSHGAKANMFGVIVKLFSGLPVVSTIHSDYKLDYLQSVAKRYTYGLINTLSLRLIDYHINVSLNLKETLIKRGFSPQTLFSIPNGLDFSKPVEKHDRKQFAQKYGIDAGEGDILVGILARLTPIKGVDVFIDAAKEVLSRNPSIKFVIGGDGEQRKQLQKRAASYGISDRVFFIGWVDDTYQFMSCMDINVLSSISEGFPYVILEGAFCKKATVSSNVGGISELIENGENGYLFEPGDYKALAARILELASDTEKRELLGQRIHEKARERFSLESMSAIQKDIYRKILEYEEKKAHEGLRSKYDVIISGSYGIGNIGDEAILKAMVANLRQCRDNVRILVLSKRPSETRLNFGVDSINRINALGILRAMRRAKLFISGGGTLIQDITSTRSLMLYVATIWAAYKMGLKIMLYANGLGPVNGRINRELVRRILSRVDVITLRENKSIQELKRFSINSPRVILTADPALNLDAAEDYQVDRIFEIEGIDPSRPLVGFSVRKWKGQEHYVGVIAAAADHMVEKYGITPLFIPMQYPDDLKVTNSIIARMKHRAFVISRKYSKIGEDCVLGIIKRAQLIIGMRLHSLIFAASQGVPVVGLVYDPKIEAFLKSIGQPSSGRVEELDFDTLARTIDDVWHRRDEIRKQLKESILPLKAKAFENARIALDLIGT